MSIRPIRPFLRALAPTFAVLLLATGCSENFYRGQTTLHSDGRVDRAIYQPADQTPDDVVEADAWTRTTFAPRLEPEDWPQSPSAFPAATRDQQRPYFAAEGSFASAAEIPAHFVRKGPTGERAGTLTPMVTRTDYVFITEHRWEETLNDIVTLEDMHAARGDLAEIGITLATFVLEEGLGDEYDVSRVPAWLRSDGVAWLNDFTDIYYDAAVRKEFRQPGVVEARLHKASERYGLTRFDNEDVERFVREKLRQLLRRRDGQPVEEAAIDHLLTLEFRSEQETSTPASPLQKHFDRAVEEKYGGSKALEKKLLGLLVRITGLYGPFRTPDRFEYELTMPGAIVETTGVLTSERSVRWSFHASDAYPLGYRMSCRAFESNTALQTKLLPQSPLSTRKAQLAFLDLVSRDADLLDAVRQCRALGSMAPLENYLIQVQQEGDAKRATAAERLWKLLHR